MEQNKAYQISFNKETNYVVMVWKGYSTTKEFREGAETMLDMLSHNYAAKVLGDIKDMILISSDDQNWLNNDFLPRAVNKGLRTMALVQPDHYFNRIAVETVSFKVDKQKLTIQFFKDIESADSWLVQQNEN